MARRKGRYTIRDSAVRVSRQESNASAASPTASSIKATFANFRRDDADDDDDDDDDGVHVFARAALPTAAACEFPAVPTRGFAQIRQLGRRAAALISQVEHVFATRVITQPH
jgi:hypothetical protein